MFFPNNLVEVLSKFWPKWVMKLCILFMPTEYKVFLNKGELPPYNSHQGGQPPGPLRTPRSQTVLPTIPNEMTPMHRCEQRGGGAAGPTPIFDDSRRKRATWGNLELVEAWNFWWKCTNWDIITKLCEFYLWKGLSWAFKTLNPWASGGSAPWTPGAMMESPMKTVQIEANWQFSAELHVNFTPDLTL